MVADIDPMARPPARPVTVNVIYDIGLRQHAREHAAGTRPTRLPYGMEQLQSHGFRLTDADRYRPNKATTVLEHRTGVRLQPLRAWPVARRADLTFAVWEHWAELPSLLRRVPGPYRDKPLVTLACWAAQDLVSSEARGAARARRMIEGSDLIAYLSHNQTQIFLEHGAREDQLVPLTFGVPVDYFEADVDGERDIDFLSVGVDRGRDYATLLRAVTGTELRVTLVTQPQRAGGVDLPRNVEAIGVLPPHEYRAMLQRSRVVVVPTHDFAYPTGQTVALNAAAAGAAVIVSKTDAMAEYFSDETTALMPPVGDAEALRSAMTRLFEDPDERTELARRGQHHVRTHHASHVMWDQLAVALRRVLPGHSTT